MTTEETGKLTASPTFWGSVVGGVTGLVNGFNYKKQENDLAMMQAQADIANSNASTERSANMKQNMVWLAVGAAAIVVIILLTRKSN